MHTKSLPFDFVINDFGEWNGEALKSTHVVQYRLNNLKS